MPAGFVWEREGKKGESVMTEQGLSLIDPASGKQLPLPIRRDDLPLDAGGEALRENRGADMPGSVMK